jgi:hypothetical protein
MSTYRVRFSVSTEVVVELDAPDEETAEDRAHDMARDRLYEVAVYSNGVGIFGDVDGIGSDETTEVSQ